MSFVSGSAQLPAHALHLPGFAGVFLALLGEITSTSNTRLLKLQTRSLGLVRIELFLGCQRPALCPTLLFGGRG